MRFGNIGDLIAFDIEASRDGRPLDLGGGRTLWIRRAGGHNRRVRYVTARVHEELADQREAAKGNIEKMAEVIDESDRRIAAHNIVARWEGFEAPDGKPIECTPEAVLELFDLAPDVYRQVLEMAEDEEGYRLQADTKSTARRGAVGASKRGNSSNAPSSAAQGSASP